MKWVFIILVIFYCKRSFGKGVPGLPLEISYGMKIIPPRNDYVGCYNDKVRPKLLNYFAGNDLDSQTPQNCIKKCKPLGYAYAGLEYGIECYCGSKNVILGQPVDEASCGMPCSGDASKKCGDDGMISIYNLNGQQPGDNLTALGDEEISNDMRLEPDCQQYIPTTSYIGCFKDNKYSRLLVHFSHYDQKLTPEHCVEECKHLGYTYSGVEYSVECYCGSINTILKERLSENSCNMPCSADHTKICGGDSAINVYSIIDFPGTRPLPPHCPVIPPTISYLGCFKDSKSYRLLIHFFDNFLYSLSPESCINSCKQCGYVYAGVEFGYECYCGGTSTILKERLPESSCNMPCSGEKNKICGGDGAISVYSVMAPISPPDRPLFPDSNYVGCYEDRGRPKLLMHFVGNDVNSQSPAFCISKCKELGYAYAGVEYGAECHCGSGSTVLGNRQDEASCRMPCTGDINKRCGDDGMISVYLVNGPTDDRYTTQDCRVPAPIQPHDQQLPPGSSYMGCYEDRKRPKLLRHFYGNDVQSQTPTNCIYRCKPLGYAYAGLEYGVECHCGSADTVLGNPLSEAACRMPCTGDNTKRCGDDGIISVYLINAAAPPLPPQDQQLPPGGSYMGCYEDKRNPRLLIYFAANDPYSQTPTNCINKCKPLGYTYAGLEYGAQCYCGSETTILANPRGEASCRMPCTGDRTKVCGDDGMISIYLVDAQRRLPILTNPPDGRQPIWPRFSSPGARLPGLPGLPHWEPRLPGLPGLPHWEPRLPDLPRFTLPLVDPHLPALPGLPQWQPHLPDLPRFTLPPVEPHLPDLPRFTVPHWIPPLPELPKFTIPSWQPAPPLPPQDQQLPPGSSYMGCYEDRNMPKLLSHFYGNDGQSQTPVNCIKNCKGLGYAYAGLEYGAECYCGSINTILVNPQSEDSCRMPCSGDKTKRCGDVGMISVYLVDAQVVLPRLTTPPWEPETPTNFINLISTTGCYVGCFEDPSNVLLDFLFGKDINSLTPGYCINACKGAGFAYAGVEAGNRCYCGSKYVTLKSRVDESFCKMPCACDNTQTCGGYQAISAYLVNVGPGNAPSLQMCPSNSNQKGYVGCYKDSNANRLLKEHFERVESLTPKICMDLCKEHRHNFAGVENGVECYCGNYNPQREAPENEFACNSPCGGDRNQFCGGELTINVYSVKDGKLKPWDPEWIDRFKQRGRGHGRHK